MGLSSSGSIPSGPASPLLESGVVAVLPLTVSSEPSLSVGCVAASVVGWVVGWVVGAVVGAVVGVVVGAVVGVVVGMVVGVVAVELPRHPASSSAKSAAAPTS